MREPIGSVLQKLRLKYGFGNLTNRFDREIVELSLTRNCLVHNGSRADPKLSAAQPSFYVGQPIDVNLNSVMAAIHVYRGFAVPMDSLAEPGRRPGISPNEPRA
jgi:hypothetical protein